MAPNTRSRGALISMQHRPAGKLSRLLKPPEMGGGIGFQAQQYLLYSAHDCSSDDKIAIFLKLF